MEDEITNTQILWNHVGWDRDGVWFKSRCT